VKKTTSAVQLHCSDSKRYQIAEHAGWQIVRVYKDRGISGAKQRQAAGVRRPSQGSGPSRVRCCNGWSVGLIESADANQFHLPSFCQARAESLCALAAAAASSVTYHR
jgi:hypothetical protein